MGDYSDASLVKSELRASEDFSSTTIPTLSEVSNWIEEESAYIDAKANRVFGVEEYSEFIHYDGEAYLFVRHTPLVGITTIKYNTSSNGVTANWVTLTPEVDFVVDTKRGMVVLLSTTYSYSNGYNKFEITYDSGYETLPLQVQMLTTKRVAQRVLNSLLAQNVNERNDGGSISVGDISIVEPGNYGVGSYKQLGTDINKLEEDIVGGFRVFRYG